jgi:hypothetical protein
MQKLEIRLPQSFVINRRRRFKRSEIEHLKRCLIAKGTGAPAPEYAPPAVEEFVGAPAVAKELAISRRTLSRRIAASTAGETLTSGPFTLPGARETLK